MIVAERDQHVRPREFAKIYAMVRARSPVSSPKLHIEEELDGPYVLIRANKVLASGTFEDIENALADFPVTKQGGW